MILNVVFVLACILAVLLIFASVKITKWEKEQGYGDDDD